MQSPDHSGKLRSFQLRTLHYDVTFLIKDYDVTFLIKDDRPHQQRLRPLVVWHHCHYRRRRSRRVPLPLHHVPRRLLAVVTDRLWFDERRPNLEGRLTVHGSLFLGVEPRIARHGACRDGVRWDQNQYRPR